MTRSTLGAVGERDALAFLVAKGLTLVASNWHGRIGEIDLIMFDGDELVLVEVKARRGDRSGRAEEAIGPAKSRALLGAAARYVSEHPEHHSRIWRIDLLALTYDGAGRIERIAHIPNAVVSDF